MNILSFNIRCSYGDGGTPNIWKNRREACLDVIREGGYDLVGLQEVVWNPDVPDGRYPSDHYPIRASFRWEDRA